VIITIIIIKILKKRFLINNTERGYNNIADV
jgi:hypothetical protein